MNYRNYLPSFLRSVPTPYLVGGTVVIVAVIGFGVRHFMPATPAGAPADAGVPAVQLSTVGDLSAQAGPLSVVGTVKSKSQATILAQTSGELTSLSASIGDRVVAGGVIGQFENSSQRAAVTQAQGAYDAAQAALTKASGTTATNSGVTAAQASTAAQNAATSLTVTFRSTYASLDDAIHTKADTLFQNPNGATPALLGFTIPDTQLVSNIQGERLALNAIFKDADSASDPASTADPDERARRLLDDARQIGLFLEDMIAALNQAVPNSNFSATTIAADQATLAAARTEVVTAVSALTTAKGAYDAALAGATTASNSATQGTQSDIASAQANLKSAQGALDAAKAALEKTIVRSPISGTIVSLPVTQGDFVSNFAQVAVVSNPGALYVDAQVTPDDAKSLSVGNPATVENAVPGTIMFVAPALDPATGKIEVKVGLTGSQGTLTDGEAVSLSLGRNRSAATKTQSAQIAIPIVSIKVTPAGPVVFTVTASSTLAAQPIQLGSILGDRVVVNGISPDTVIITDARGHSTGEKVIVASSTAAAL